MGEKELPEKEPKKQKKFGAGNYAANRIVYRIALIALVLFVCGAIYLGFRLGRFSMNDLVTPKEEITETILYQQLTNVKELATVNYYYTNMASFQSSKLIGDIKIPFTTKAFIISYDGVVKSGVDLSETELKLVNNEIVIKIPEAKILSHEMMEETFTVYDEKSAVFNGISVSDVSDLLAEQKEKMEQKVLSSGIMEDAKKRAGEVLTSIYAPVLQDGQSEGYTIVFE